MFSGIAGRYDLLNTLLSAGIDRLWRREAARLATESATRILDVATGTGELAFELKRQAPAAVVTGVDFAEPMLEVARRKATAQGRQVEFLHADALELPFEAGTFDSVTIAYGLRNLADVDGALSEFARVLRPGGRLVILEFPPPPDGVLGEVYRFYFRNILPRVGGAVSGSRAAYEYLPQSVLAFPEPPALAQQMIRAGFGCVRYRLQSMGISAVFTGEKR